MKLKERSYGHYLRGLFIMTLFPALAVWVTADVPREKEISLLLTSLFFGGVFGLVSMAIGILLFRSVPNGMARPEDELPRGAVLTVHRRDGNSIGLLGIPGKEEKTIFWEFEAPPAELQYGNRIVYLDDSDAYLLKWQKEGVILILSKKGQAEESDSLRGHLEQKMKDVSLGILK